MMMCVRSWPVTCERSEPAARRASSTPATRKRVAASRSASAIVNLVGRSLISSSARAWPRARVVGYNPPARLTQFECARRGALTPSENG
jgi:hypothetical protein